MKRYAGFLLMVLLLLSGCGAQVDAEPFLVEDITDLFDLTEADVRQMYGEPDAMAEDHMYDLEYHAYTFGDNQFGFCNFGDGQFVLCEATIADQRIRGTRDIALGDSLKEVRKKYPDDGQKETYPLEGYQGEGGVEAEYRLLYGDYVHMSDYGIEVEASDNTQRLVYSNEGVILRYHFEDKKLVSMEYIVQVV